VEFVEHNNRKEANKFAEYITGQPLRKYLADKVKHFCGENISIFDGAAGSGQLEQFINMKALYAIEIQRKSCEALKTNFPNAIVNNQSFFTYQTDIQVDATVMNPPYSLRLKDLPGEDQEAIKELFPWKKSGVVDDVFLLKSLNHTKRYGFYIMFPGVAYRKTEKKMRELIGNNLVELNVIQNGFEDTPVNVLFLVIDKEKENPKISKEIYDCRNQKVEYRETDELNSDFDWVMPTKPVEKEKIDIDQVNAELDQMVIDRLENHLANQLVLIEYFNADIDLLNFITKCHKVLDDYLLMYNFAVKI
jgi:predicted RNA methylase